MTSLSPQVTSEPLIDLPESPSDFSGDQSKPTSDFTEPQVTSFKPKVIFLSLPVTFLNSQVTSLNPQVTSLNHDEPYNLPEMTPLRLQVTSQGPK